MDAYPQNQGEFLQQLAQSGLDPTDGKDGEGKLQFLKDRYEVNKWIAANANNKEYFINDKPLPNPTVNVRNPAMFKDAGQVATSRKDALDNAIAAGNKLLVAAVQATDAKTQPSYKQGVAEGRLNEFAPGDDEEKTLLFYARTWYNGDLPTQQQVEAILDRMGWEIGEIEDGEGGCFVVAAGDEHGRSYIPFSIEDLTGGQLDEIKKGQKDANGYTRCWPGKHAEGTKKGKNGGQVRRCVPNKSVAESSLKDKIDRLQRRLLEMKLAVSLAKKTPL
jgi:hypothetical protein